MLLLAARIATEHDAARIRDTARQVIERPEFDLGSSPQLNFSISNELWQWIARLFEPILRFFGHLWEMSPTLAIVLIVILVLLLMSLTGHIIYTIYRAVQVGGKNARLKTAAAQMTDPATFEKAAEEAARRHDYIGAVRLLFRACLLRLERLDKRAPRPGMTNREYLRRYQNTRAYDALGLFVEIIDAKWYGYGTCEMADYTVCRQANEAVKRGIVSSG